MPSRAATEVAEHLRELIQCGDLVAGERLPPQRELAAELGVGRPALREALAVLEQEGYVATQRGAHGGSFVRTLVQPAARWLEEMREHPALFDEIIDFRIAIESRLAALAAHRRTEEDIAGLEAAIAVLDGDMGRPAFRAADARFHTLLARSARNTLLERADRRARAAMFVPADQLVWPTLVTVTRRQHATILRALVAGDAARAARAATAHVERTRADSHSLILGGSS